MAEKQFRNVFSLWFHVPICKLSLYLHYSLSGGKMDARTTPSHDYNVKQSNMSPISRIFFPWERYCFPVARDNLSFFGFAHEKMVKPECVNALLLSHLT